MSQPAIRIKALHKTFKGSLFKPSVTALKGVSLEVSEGEIYGLIGPNGSGKSTLMKALLGLCIPTNGSCELWGLNSLRYDSRQNLGYLPENPYFYKHLTGEETLTFYGKLSKVPASELQERVRNTLEKVSLYEARNRKLSTYSKGMLQRIGIAQAIIHDPKLLILDEPTAGVDPIGCGEIKELILSFQNEGKTIFLCSHLLEHLQTICDRIGMMEDGQLKAEGSIAELLEHPSQRTLLIEGCENSQKAVIDFIQNHENVRLISHETKQDSLEDLFLKIAKKKV